MVLKYSVVFFPRPHHTRGNQNYMFIYVYMYIQLHLQTKIHISSVELVLKCRPERIRAVSFIPATLKSNKNVFLITPNKTKSPNMQHSHSLRQRAASCPNPERQMTTIHI